MALKFLETVTFGQTGVAAITSDTKQVNLDIDDHCSALVLRGTAVMTPTNVTAGAYPSDVRMANWLKAIECYVRGTVPVKKFFWGKDAEQFDYLLRGNLQPETKPTIAVAALTAYYDLRLELGLYRSQFLNAARTWIDRRKVARLNLKLVSAAESDILATVITAYVYNSHKVDVYADTERYNPEASGKGTFLGTAELVEHPSWTTAATTQLVKFKDYQARKLVGIGLVTEDDAILSSTRVTNIKIIENGGITHFDTTFAKQQMDNLQQFLPQLSTVRAGIAYFPLDTQRNGARWVDTGRCSSFNLQYDRAATGGTTSRMRVYAFSVPRVAKP